MNIKIQRVITFAQIRKAALTLAVLVVIFNIGYRLGLKKTNVQLTPEKKLVINSNPPAAREVDFSLFWTVWDKLESQYVDKTKIDPQRMVDGAISGMVASLGDPYTVYLPPKENTEYKEDLNGSFEGIGAQLGAKDDKIVVVSPLKDHPAEKAGVRAGDWIQKVNGEETFGWSVPQAVTKIRGAKGTKVTLTLAREGNPKPFDVVIVRDAILIKSVEFAVKEASGSACLKGNCPNIGYIKLIRFGDHTNDEWDAAVRDLRGKMASSPPLKGVVLDLRNNPGGYLQSAIYIASEFIRSGTVVAQENSDGTKETYSVTRVGSLLDVPLVVLTNKGSASAAEIVAGALKDNARGRLVGETTFGKGSIQTPQDLPGGAGLHITTARWILPKGDWIDKKGIKPDLEVKTPEATDAADLQLEQALGVLTK